MHASPFANKISSIPLPKKCITAKEGLVIGQLWKTSGINLFVSRTVQDI